jgi:isopentenyl-diphosphate delta-isomerase
MPVDPGRARARSVVGDDWTVTGAAVRDTVILVDEHGGAVGTAPKLEAHRPPGQLHLAISVFLYRPDGKMLIQRRAASKYHFPGVWANACCSHPSPGEPIDVAAVARVREELGLEVELRRAGAIAYRATCQSSGLVEFEYDWVFVGETSDAPVPDPHEIEVLRFVTVDDLEPGRFDGSLAPWFAPALALAEAARAVTRS